MKIFLAGATGNRLRMSQSANFSPGFCERVYFPGFDGRI